MEEEERDSSAPDLGERLLEAFMVAYPDIAPDDLEHEARNFIQVVRGIIDIGRRVGDGSEVTQMDVANGLVYSCFRNTYLEEMYEGEWDERLEDSRIARLSEREMDLLMSECVARVADWLVGLEVLRNDPVLYKDFVKGAVALGAVGWERRRGELKY